MERWRKREVERGREKGVSVNGGLQRNEGSRKVKQKGVKEVKASYSFRGKIPLATPCPPKLGCLSPT